MNKAINLFIIKRITQGVSALVFYLTWQYSNISYFQVVLFTKKHGPQALPNLFLVSSSPVLLLGLVDGIIRLSWIYIAL